MFPAITIALLIGGIIGVMIGRRVAPRPQRPSDPDSSASRPDPVDAAPNQVDGILRAAVDRSDRGVLVGDADGRVVYRNQAATALTGTHVGLLIEEHVERVLQAACAGESVEDTLDLHGPPRRSLLLTAEPMPRGLAVVAIEDVSDVNRIEAMRTDFVANISHELKTPVGAIAVLGEALIGETDSEVIDRVASRMIDEAHRAASAIDDLLELARIESGPLLEEIVDLEEVVAVAIARGRVADAPDGVTVTAFDGYPNVRVRADRRQLVAALGNLVENAVKYSDPGGAVQVRVRVDDRAIEVMVVDHGIGIPKRDLDRIFERFYRVDRARSRTTGGTGLGLSIVRHVASNHSGEVLVSSEEGEGSTFVLRLPISMVVDDDQPEPDRADAEPSRSPTLETSMGRMTDE